MTEQTFDTSFLAEIAEKYERYFVPAIAEPLAKDLVQAAGLRPGERVLDVACGTGIVARLAAQQVGGDGSVAGVDPNPGMLAVARSITSTKGSIEWHQASAESMPVPSDAFDVVLCQVGLQFMPNPLAALQEMRRVLVPGGRLLVNVPGPAGPVFDLFAREMERHVGPQAAGFVRQVFALDDENELRALATEAGFGDVTVDATTKLLRLPPPRAFLWQYVESTPLAGLVARSSEASRDALERDVVAKWQEFAENGSMQYRQRVLTVEARK